MPDESDIQLECGYRATVGYFLAVATSSATLRPPRRTPLAGLRHYGCGFKHIGHTIHVLNAEPLITGECEAEVQDRSTATGREFQLHHPVGRRRLMRPRSRRWRRAGRGDIDRTEREPSGELRGSGRELQTVTGIELGAGSLDLDLRSSARRPGPGVSHRRHIHIGAQVGDATGRSNELAWIVTVTVPAHPPTITKVAPSGTWRYRPDEREPSGELRDQDANLQTVNWYVNSVLDHSTSISGPPPRRLGTGRFPPPALSHGCPSGRCDQPFERGGLDRDRDCAGALADADAGQHQWGECGDGMAYSITVNAADADGNLANVDVIGRRTAVEHHTVSGSSASTTFTRSFSTAQTINWSATAYDTTLSLAIR